jgi:hypothetical protein
MFSGFLIFLKIVLAVSIIGKCYLHAYIAYRNNVILGGAGLPFKTFWYFTKPVANDYIKLKKLCNYLQSGNMLLLFLLFIISILFD